MNRSPLPALLLAVCVVGLGLGATLPLVSLRLLQAGASSWQIGMLAALPAAGMMLAASLIDCLCRRLDRRRLFLASLLLCALSSAALEWPLPDSLLTLGALRLLSGMGFGVLIILSETWVNELCRESSRGRVVALYTTLFTACQLLGPALVALCGAASPWVIVVVVSAHGVALVAVARLGSDAVRQTDPAPDEQRFSLLGFIRLAPALCMAVVFFAFFDAVVLSLFPLYATSQGHDASHAAWMASVILAGDMLCQIPLGWLADRHGRARVHALCGSLALLLGLALPWLIERPLLLWPALMVLGAVAGGVYTLALVRIGERFRGRELVTANASAGLLWGLGSLLGPLLSGVLMEVGEQGLPAALTLMAALFVMTLLLPTARGREAHAVIRRS